MARARVLCRVSCVCVCVCLCVFVCVHPIALSDKKILSPELALCPHGLWPMGPLALGILLVMGPMAGPPHTHLRRIRILKGFISYKDKEGRMVVMPLWLCPLDPVSLIPLEEEGKPSKEKYPR